MESFIALAIATVLLLLRLLWNFEQTRKTLRETLRQPKQVAAVPPHLSSWIPFLGSAVEMATGTNPPLDFIQSTAKKLDSAVFTATINGKKCAFLADSRYLPALFVNRTSAWNRDAPHVHALKQTIGCCKSEASLMYAQIHSALPRYLMNKDNLVSMLPDLQGVLARELVADFNYPVQVAGLMESVSKHIFVASAETLLSPVLASRDLVSIFHDFNKGFPLAFAGVPHVLLPKYRAALNHLMSLVAKPEHLEEGSDLVQIIRELNVSKDSQHRANVMALWASIGNSLNAVFWTLYHILADSNGAYESIQREIDHVYPEHDSCLTLEQLDALVETRSAFKEACRMQSGSFHVRDLDQDFILEPKTSQKLKSQPPKFFLKKGTRIMGYGGVQHFDEAIFEKPFEFQWNRFAPLENGNMPEFKDRNGKTLSNPSLAFGGGSHACPGRRFIDYESTAYIAMLLARFDLRLVSNDYPGIAKESIGVGIFDPEIDVQIEIRQRVRG